MNSVVLKSLMQLFALIAYVGKNPENGRAVVRRYLTKQVKADEVDAYIDFFNSHLMRYSGDGEKVNEKKQVASLSVKILKICSTVNNELTQIQKLIVLIRLIEFQKSNSEKEDIAEEFSKAVAESFHISLHDYEKCIGLILGQDTKINNSAILTISSEKSGLNQTNNWIIPFELNGELRILKLESSEFLFLWSNMQSGLELNGQKVEAQTVYILGNGSILRINKNYTIYFNELKEKLNGDIQKSPFYFTVKQLEHSFNKNTKALHKLSFSVKGGNLCSIMGGSGAGKSTLLNLLNGSDKAEKGKILINGTEVDTADASFKSIIGFVSQDDLLIGELSVFDNLYYSAKLSLGNISDEEVREKVNHTLKSLGLEKIKHLKVGNPIHKTISGGQRKRLNIALELISEPEILFLDEPTSGLSSIDSERILELLKGMCLAGKLVFVVIHQPSSNIFKMFDFLILLDLGGYPIFQGNPLEAAPYFKHVTGQLSVNDIECSFCHNLNPEQIFEIIEAPALDEIGEPTDTRKVSPAEWYIFYKQEFKSTFSPNIETLREVKSTYTVPERLKQAWFYFRRDLKTKLSDKQYLLINLLEAPLLAFIMSFFLKTWNSKDGLGYTFYHNSNIAAYLLICVISALFIGLTLSAEEIFKDRNIRKREQFLSLSYGSYISSKTILMFCFSAIQTASFVVIGNAMLEIQNMFFPYWWIMFSTACFSNLLGLNISSAFKSVVTIYVLIPLLIIPQLLLSGIIVRYENLHPSMVKHDKVPFLAEIMVSKWAYEALAVHQFTHNTYEKQFYHFNQVNSVTNYHNQYWIKEVKKILSEVLHSETPVNKENVEKVLKELTKSLPEMAGLPVFKGEPDITQFLEYLETLQSYLFLVNKSNGLKKENLVNSKQTDDWHKLKLMHQNENLEKMLRRYERGEKIIRDGHKLIQVSDPIYMIPKRNFVAHHFAPVKKVGAFFIPTLHFNALVIWIFCLFLYVALYYKWLAKIINAF